MCLFRLHSGDACPNDAVIYSLPAGVEYDTRRSENLVLKEV